MAGVRDLYELLLQKEAMENRLQQQQLQGQHEIVRKANRSPSLRLRFGRRADPMLTVRALRVSLSPDMTSLLKTRGIVSQLPKYTVNLSLAAGSCSNSRVIKLLLFLSQTLKLRHEVSVLLRIQL